MLRAQLYHDVLAARDMSFGDYLSVPPLLSDEYHTLLTIKPNETRTQIQEKIQRLRAADFDFYSEENKTLVKHHTLASDFEYDPISPYEAQIQALRYLQGMLLIAENSNKGPSFLQGIHARYQAYLNREEVLQKNNPQSLQRSVNNTRYLVEDFASLLVREKISPNMDKGRKQVTMARDLGILLEEHPAVVTISEVGIRPAAGEDKGKQKADQIDKQITIQRSTPFKVSAAFYDQEFTNLDAKKWFQKAKKSGGMEKSSSPWLENFFTNNFAQLKARGVSAPPSARWLPLPANNQTVEIVVAEEVNGQLKNETHSRFTRMGITSAFAISDLKEQKRLAIEQLKEVLQSQLSQAMTDFQTKYESLVEAHDGFDFFVDYQTLLTPHYVESSMYKFLKDNNARFVEMAKEAMQEVAKKLMAEYGGEITKDGVLLLDTGVRIHFSQTNAAVNKRSEWFTAKQFAQEKKEREKKLQITGRLLERVLGNTLYLNYIRGEKTSENIDFETSMNKQADKLAQGKSTITDIQPELQRELATRLRAAFYLRQLLNQEGLFKKINTYQRNIMMGALEFHAQGSQAVNLIGCKSARDRTSIVMAAIEAMQKDPTAMKDWQVLDAQIQRSLLEGHGFRSMIWHSAIVKVSDVHGHFMKKMPYYVQHGIKLLQNFAKKLDPFKPKSSTAIVRETIGYSDRSVKHRTETANVPVEPKGKEIADEAGPSSPPENSNPSKRRK